MPHYLHYDREQLDQQYNVRSSIPRFQSIFERWRESAYEYRKQHQLRTNLRYGQHRLQTLDYLQAEQAGAPLLVFVHGGYWRSLDKSDFTHIAEPYRQAGIAVALLNYRLTPEVEMPEIIADVRSAFAWLHGEADKLGFDADNMYVAGHSTGAHLTTMLASTDWRDTKVPEDAVKGLCSISGIYDLEPIRRSYLNEALKLDEAQVTQCSPLHHLPRLHIPILLTAGSTDSTEFQCQLAAYARRLQAEGFPVRPIGFANGHHLDMIDQLAQVGSAQSESLIALIKA